LKGIDNVGITSGASTPEVLVEEVIKYLNPDEVVPMGGEEENITFKLPANLR
jgi:4-hydroxy-3-methylbut-2-enyl diphosphate reductase